MLVILLGPSGVGKTTLMRVLSERWGYSLCRAVTTRPPRGEELDRVSVAEAQFDDMEHASTFAVVTEAYGFRYGLLRSSVEEYSNDSTVAMLDFAIENVDHLDALPGQKMGVLVLPPTWEDLRRRLVERGREDRVPEVRKQYETYSRLMSEATPRLIGDRIVVNRDLGAC